MARVEEIKDPSFDGEASARKTLEDLMSDIRNTLSRHTLTKDDQMRLAVSVSQLEPAFEALARIIEPTRSQNPDVFKSFFICIQQLMMSSFYAGAICVISDSASDYIKKPLKDGGKSVGRRRGEQLKTEADAKWRDEARKLWEEKRANPKNGKKLSQDKLAEEIAIRIPSAPGHRQIVVFIRSIERKDSVDQNGRLRGFA